MWFVFICKTFALAEFHNTQIKVIIKENPSTNVEPEHLKVVYSFLP